MSSTDEPTRGNAPEFRRGADGSPSRGARRLALAAIAVLVIALATAGAIIAVQQPPSPRGLVATVSGPDGQATCSAAFSPDGTTLALFSGDDLTTCLWNLATRRETTLTDPGPRPSVAWTQGAFSPGLAAVLAAAVQPSRSASRLASASASGPNNSGLAATVIDVPAGAPRRPPTTAPASVAMSAPAA
jgi:hypothetical protein